ncbi:MAG: alpha-2-macroglobulin family protein, partial [Pseudomonadota bacterium]
MPRARQTPQHTHRDFGAHLGCPLRAAALSAAALLAVLGPATAKDAQAQSANAAAPTAAPNTAPPAKAFRHDDSRAAADAYAAWIAKAWKPNRLSAAAHVSAGEAVLDSNGDPDLAARKFARAIATDAKSADAWHGLARALLAKPQKSLRGAQRYATPRNAAGAAHRAYDLASTQQQKAAALASLAEALTRRSYWRPALDALRTSLALEPSSAVQARYDALRAQHGFRIVNYDVEIERKQPRLCVRFSEPLRATAATSTGTAAFDYTAFLALDGRDPQTPTVEGNRLCVNGLTHGETHTLRVREGLPAKIDDRLVKTVDLAVFVKDRAPSVRASAKRFVLPMSGQNGIPLTSINTRKLDIDIYRIGDRGMMQALTDGTFGRGLDQWERSNIARTRGAKVYTGTLATRMQRNTEVTTALPVTTAITDFKPGIYALHAKPSGQEATRANAATQWFVVSDIGLTTISGQDGVHVFVKSLSTARTLAGVSVALIARNNDVLATATSNDSGQVTFPARLTRGEGGAAAALVTAQADQAGYAFLRLTEAAFDLTD